MTRVRGSIDIARPVELVFDFVADQRNEPRYNPSMSDSFKITDGPIGVGIRFRATILRRGKPFEMVTCSNSRCPATSPSPNRNGCGCCCSPSRHD